MTKKLLIWHLKLASMGVFVLSLSAAAFANELKSNVPPDFNNPDFSCGNIVRGMDYRRSDEEAIILKRQVEGAHFTKGVQRGEYGNTASLEGDLNYVLNKFPNHPKALLVAARNQMRPSYNPSRPLRKDRFWPDKECYFQLALRRAPTDPSVHLVIAIFYHEFENFKVAARHYQNAIKLGPMNPEAHYNYGLFLIDINRADEALKHAKQAYAIGYPLEGLKNRLKRQNAWKEG